LAAVISLSAPVGDRMVNGSSYGDERRMPLRPPGVLLLGPFELGHQTDLVARNSNGAGVVGEGTLHTLTDPPGGIGAELEAAAVLVLIHSTHQAAVTFLNEVGERQAAVAVVLGDADDEPQVRLGKLSTDFLKREAALPQNRHHLWQFIGSQPDLCLRVEECQFTAGAVVGARGGHSRFRQPLHLWYERFQFLTPALEQLGAR
jgi:hypothetical protein